jgi:hypothetical protein
VFATMRAGPASELSLVLLLNAALQPGEHDGDRGREAEMRGEEEDPHPPARMAIGGGGAAITAAVGVLSLVFRFG